MSELPRRDMLTAVASAAAAILGARTLLHTSPAGAQAKPTSPPAPTKPDHSAHIARAAPLPAAAVAGLAAIVSSTESCQRDGRFCLARCTDHLAAGMQNMDHCQRAVMNMLAVTSAMNEVAGYRNASPKNIKALASTCAAFCRACATACEVHKDQHAECKACMEACLECAKACEALTV